MSGSPSLVNWLGRVDACLVGLSWRKTIEVRHGCWVATLSASRRNSLGPVSLWLPNFRSAYLATSIATTRATKTGSVGFKTIEARFQLCFVRSVAASFGFEAWRVRCKIFIPCLVKFANVIQLVSKLLHFRRIFLLWGGVDIAGGVVFPMHVRFIFRGRIFFLSCSYLFWGKFFRLRRWSWLDTNNFLGRFLLGVVDFGDIVICLHSVFFEHVTIVRVVVLGRLIVLEQVLRSIGVVRLKLLIPYWFSWLRTGVFVWFPHTSARHILVSIFPDASTGSSRCTSYVITIHIAVSINPAAFWLLVIGIISLILLLDWGVLSHFWCLVISLRLLIRSWDGAIVILRRIRSTIVGLWCTVLLILVWVSSIALRILKDGSSLCRGYHQNGKACNFHFLQNCYKFCNFANWYDL